MGKVILPSGDPGLSARRADELGPVALPAALEGVSAAARDKFTVACIYFPGFHPTPFLEAWHGFGWDEWDLVTRARPRFPGHRQPLEPAWGPYDESDPAWSAREVDLAADHGIDAWIFDWYWYSGVEIWNEALDRGFLQAPNRARMKFGLMWANHTWQETHPAPLTGPLPDRLPIRHSPEDLDRVLDIWSERYFSQPNCWRIEGRPWCSFYLLSSLLDQLGGEAGVGRAVERMRRRAQRNGEPDLFLGLFAGTPQQGRLALKLGFDHLSTYNLHEGRAQPRAQARVDYADVMLAHMDRWLEFLEAGLPYWPVVTQGWDVSARVHPFEPWPPQRWAWPWGHIVEHNTPERFARLVEAARRLLALQRHQPKVLVLNAWNEWTEGSVLLPTKDWENRVLENMKAALG